MTSYHLKFWKGRYLPGDLGSRINFPRDTKLSKVIGHNRNCSFYTWWVFFVFFFCFVFLFFGFFLQFWAKQDSLSLPGNLIPMHGIILRRVYVPRFQSVTCKLLRQAFHELGAICISYILMLIYDFAIYKVPSCLYSSVGPRAILQHGENEDRIIISIWRVPGKSGERSRSLPHS